MPLPPIMWAAAAYVLDLSAPLCVRAWGIPTYAFSDRLFVYF